MPTYTYRCTECDKEKEIFHPMNYENKDSCPECGGTLQKIIKYAPSVVYKSDGFYITDNKEGGSDEKD